MPSLAEKIRFAETHIRTPDGEPFSLKGRSWVVEQLWRPLDGWKLWPVNAERLCASCSAKANTIVEDYNASDETRAPAHAKKNNCAGLTSEPILIVAVELKRQSGKTFNTAALALSCAFLDDRESIALLAGSEDQVGRLYRKNYVKAVTQSEELSEAATLRGTSIMCEDTGSDLEILPTAMSSVGDTRTKVILDECRVVPPDVAVAMIPTLFARGGWQCPDHHVRTHLGVDDDTAPKKCSVCKKRTVPWYGKALLLSSSGEIKDTGADWFFEFVDHYSQNPHPNVHVFASKAGKLNPKVSQKLVDITADVFGALESTRQFAGIEAEGERLRKGEDVVTPSDVSRVSDKSLFNEEGSGQPAVGFVDTSTADEKTSIVILCEEPDCSVRWERVYLSHCRFWWPRKMRSKVIDPEEVEEYIATLLPLYPGLEWLDVDVRAGDVRARKAVEKASLVQWPTKMLRRLKTGPGAWRKKLRAWTGTEAEVDSGWDELVERVLAQRIRLQDIREVKDEFKGIRRDSKMRVRDRNRRMMHADITQGIACACYRILTLRHRAAAVTLTDVVRVQSRRVGLRATPITRGLRPGKL